MSVDPPIMDAEPINGWHRLPGQPECTSLAGDVWHELTVYYAGDDDRYAEETYYLELNEARRWSVCQMSCVGRSSGDDQEDYSYALLGLYDYPNTPEGLAAALKERDRFVAADESCTYLI